MGFLGKVRDKYKEQQDKIVAQKEAQKQARGDKVVSFPIEFMGGYNERKKTVGTLVFYQKRAEFKTLSGGFIIEKDDIASLAVEGQQEVGRRVTVTRLLATGIFAFALKKKKVDSDAFVTIVLKDGREVIFHAKDKSPMELRVRLALVVSIFGQPKTSVASDVPQNGIADELTKLADLKEKGILTQAEFNRKKQQLLE